MKSIEQWNSYLEKKRKKIQKIQWQINFRIQTIKNIKIDPPCMSCKYDGQYRCETCKEQYYAGFNVKDFPQN